MKRLLTLRCNADFAIQRKQFGDRPHIVAPVTILVEGVHIPMSGERLYYPLDVLSHVPQKWDDTATLEFHPVDQEGNPVSANSVTVQEEKVIGRLFNTRFESPALKSEIWIDEEKAKAVSPHFVEALENGENIEVSTGVFLDTEEVAGTWNGEDYDFTVKAMYPDHLALLPGGEGACNWQDGCGIRANQGEKESMKNNVKSAARQPAYKGAETLPWHEMPTSFESYRNGYYVHTNTPLPEALPDSVDQAPPEMKAWIASKTLLGDENAEDLYGLISLPVVNPATDMLNQDALSRVLSDSHMEYWGAYELPMETQKSARDVAMALLQSEFNFEMSMANEGGQDGFVKKVIDGIKGIFTDNHDCKCKTNTEVNQMDKEKVIASLIKNGQFAEEDKEMLDGLDEKVLEQLSKVKANEEPEPEEKKEPEKQIEEIKEPEANKAITAEEYINQAPPEVREVLNSSLSLQKQKKAALVKGLLDNQNNRFSEEALNAKSLEELENLASLAQVDTDFSLQGNNGKQPTDNEVPKPRRLGEKKKAA